MLNLPNFNIANAAGKRLFSYIYRLKAHLLPEANLPQAQRPTTTMSESPKEPLLLSKEELAAMPLAEFEGNIRLVDSEEEVAKAVRILSSSDVVGFDTETRPSFKKGQSHTVALLQLSTRSTAYLFRLNKTGFCKELVEFLQDPSKKKIGLSTHDDFHNLRKLCPLEPQGFVELQQYVKNFGIGECSLAKIYGLLFNRRMSKGQRLTNWEADSLTAAQQAYASLDAMACVEIYDYLSSGDFKSEMAYPRKTDSHLPAVIQ